MISVDEDALICDYAEYYNVYDYESLPVELAAALCVGLKEDSRIKMKTNGTKVNMDIMILAGIYDMIKLILWSKTKDGSKGINKPSSLVNIITGDDSKESVVYESGEDFEAARQAIIDGI